jgi:hypothetical protein
MTFIHINIRYIRTTIWAETSNQAFLHPTATKTFYSTNTPFYLPVNITGWKVKITCLKFNNITAVPIKIAVFWNVTACSLINRYELSFLG